MKLSKQGIAVRLVALCVCTFAQHLESQQVSLGLVRENAMLDWINPLTGAELVGGMPISQRVSVQLRVDRSAVSDDPRVRSDSILAFTGFDTWPQHLFYTHNMNTFGASVALPIAVVNRLPFAVSVAPGFRVTRMHYTMHTPRVNLDQDSWRTFLGPQLGAAVIVTPDWSPVGLRLSGDWGRVRANGAADSPAADPFSNTKTVRRFSVGVSWNRGMAKAVR